VQGLARKALHKIHIVGGNDDRYAHLLKTLEEAHDLGGEGGIEVPRGLVR
jgi:hypothetical protein